MNDLLDETDIIDPEMHRKKLLPLWIKVFAWIFLVLGGLAVLSVGVSFFVNGLTLAIYHLETRDTFSLAGLLISSIFLWKGITAFGLLWAKKWGVQMAIADAVTGIIICLITILAPGVIPGSDADTATNVFPLELLLLIPYLVKMLQIKKEWQAV